MEADTGTGTLITSDGDVTENRPRFCSDNNMNNPINNIGIDCSTTKNIFIPVLQTTKKFSILIGGYTQREVDLSADPNLGLTQINLRFSDDVGDCSGVTCVSALQTSIVIDKIEDELGNTIGIGTIGTIGSISKSDSTLNLSNIGDSNTTFSELNTQFNGIPYIVDGKWYAPSLSNFSDNSFKLLIAGFEQKDTLNLPSSDYTLTNPQKIIRFVKDIANPNICPVGSTTIKCFNGFKFASLIMINNIEGSFKPTDLSLTLNSSNTFIKVVKNGVTLGVNDFNGPSNGAFSFCPGETSGTNCLYISVINYLGQDQNMTIDLTIDGFTKVTYIFSPTNTFAQQQPASVSGNIFFTLKIEKIKDELDKFFKIGGICNFPDNCNNSNITIELFKIITTQTSGPAGNFTIVKSFLSGGKLFIALTGTKAISQQEDSPSTISGKLALNIFGFIGVQSQNIEISNITLSNTTQKELKFGFSNTGECPPGSTTIFCSSVNFRYKLKVTKIVAQDNINLSVLQDVTSQIGNLEGKISTTNGAQLNGIFRLGNVLYIGIYDTTLNVDGTNSVTSETIILGTPTVQFSLNNTLTIYTSINAVVAQIFFDANIATQFSLEIAPSTGTIKCSTSTNLICLNSFFTIIEISLFNISIITPANGRGFGGSTFRIKFTFLDANGKFPDSVSFTLDTDSNLNISDLDLIKNKACSLTEENSSDTDTTDGKNYFCDVVLTFVADGTNRGFNKGRFILKAMAGNFSVTEVSALNQLITILDNPPTLSDNSVNPASGSVSTTFEFRVLYKDKEGSPPSFVELLADINGNNIIESPTEIFSMQKLNINDDDFIIFGVIYTTSIKITSSPTDNILRYGFRAGDGFVDENGKAITTMLPSGFNKENISAGEFFSLSITTGGNRPQIDWVGNYGIVGFEQAKSGLGFIEPDGGNSGDNFTFLIVYKSMDNIPAKSVKILYKDKFGLRNLPLELLTNNLLNKLPSTIKSAVEIRQNLYNGDYVDGEIYFGVFPLFNSDITIIGVEVDDGNFVVTEGNFNSVVRLTITDSDSDGVDDKQEGVDNTNSSSRIALNALEDPPQASIVYTFIVSPNAVFSPPPPNPFFTSLTAPGSLEEGVLGSGKLPSPPDLDNIKLIALFQLGVRLISGDSATFTVKLPFALPAGAKIFKLGKGNVWHDITPNIFDISSDMKEFKYSVDNNSNFDKDSDFFGSSDPGGFKFIVDPIGIFAPEAPILPPEGDGGSGGGGGCSVNPDSVYKNSGKSDNKVLIITLIIFVWLLYRILIQRYLDTKSMNNPI